MRKIGVKEINDMAVGATVLGTGGGGDPYVGKLMAIQAIREFGEVTMLSPEEVPDDAIVVPSSMMGAPTVLVEKIPGGKEGHNTFNALERILGKKIYATMSIEAGGINSMLPFAVAAEKGIPIVDCDTMGRAFPELQMTSFHLYDISSTPMVLADEKGNTLTLNTINNHWTESIARAATAVMGGSTFLASYHLTGKQLREACIPYTMTQCENIGRVIREAKSQGQNPVEAILKEMGGFELFRGKVTDVSRRTDGSFVRGEAMLDGLGEDKGSEVLVNFQNEHIVARLGDETLCTAPDLIIMLDIETALPVTTEGLRYGARVVLTGVPCHEKWRTPKGIETVGPRYFGYDIDYIPVEERVKSRRGR